MNIFSLLLAGLMIIPTGKGDGDKKKKSNGNDQYYKYETQDVSGFRDRVEFEMPVPTPAVEEGETAVETQGISLSYLFNEEKNLHIEADYRLDALLQKHIQINKRIKTVAGWRIQIYAGASRQGVVSRKTTVMSRFPEIIPYTSFIQPNYVLRVGDFMEKEDAILPLRQLREVFPNAFLVPDKVNVPKYKPEELINENE